MRDQADGRARVDTDTFTLLQQLAEAGPDHQNDILAELSQRAEQAPTVEAWAAYAYGLSVCGRYADAIDVRSQLADQIDDGPQREELRLGIAANHMNLGEVNLALQELSALAETATQPRVRDEAAEQVARIRQWQQDRSEDMHWQRLKIDAMRERIAGGSAGHSDHYQLGHALIRLWIVGDSSVTQAMVDEVTAAAVHEYPGSAELHELRVLFLMRCSPDRSGELDDELLALERLDPDSSVLREYATIGYADQVRHHEQIREQLRSMLQGVLQPDPEIQTAAVRDIEALAAEFPENTEVRAGLGLALACAGHPSGAIEQAEWLVPRAGTSHALHLTLGQTFWHAGDHERGRAHFQLAYDYAANDGDRADVDSVRSGLGA
jgi:tetratricopeptide (TPR) repeat protein